MRDFAFFRPKPQLASLVESIWHADIRDRGAARATTIVILPAASPMLCFHICAPTVASDRPSFHHKHRMSGVLSRSLTLRPSGQMRSVMVRLRPEAAFRLIGGGMHEFSDIAVPLSEVFRPKDISLLDEMLAEASHPAEHVDRVQSFLTRQIPRSATDSLIHRAALSLRRNPRLSIRRLASVLDVSERQLTRRFHAVVGASPKQFARIVRIENLVAVARNGRDGWANIAHSCGFTDQAHMINEFKSMTGSPPQAFFRNAVGHDESRWNSSFAASGFPNTFVTDAFATERAAQSISPSKADD